MEAGSFTVDSGRLNKKVANFISTVPDVSKVDGGAAAIIPGP